MGFFTKKEGLLGTLQRLLSQSLSGWDGVFHQILRSLPGGECLESQSLSGWDGVFHFLAQNAEIGLLVRSQSLSGWDGVFHVLARPRLLCRGNKSQSLSGWDGVFHLMEMCRDGGEFPSRNPFQGGMGFFTQQARRGQG